MLNYAHQFIKIRRQIFETKLVTPNFYFISETKKSLSVSRRSFKKNLSSETFRANVLKNLAFSAVPPKEFDILSMIDFD